VWKLLWTKLWVVGDVNFWARAAGGNLSPPRKLAARDNVKSREHNTAVERGLACTRRMHLPFNSADMLMMSLVFFPCFLSFLG
jgi:hypothetical protein